VIHRFLRHFAALGLMAFVFADQCNLMRLGALLVDEIKSPLLCQLSYAPERENCGRVNGDYRIRGLRTLHQSVHGAMKTGRIFAGGNCFFTYKIESDGATRNNKLSLRNFKEIILGAPKTLTGSKSRQATTRL
jgi:hypothetical protein